MADTGTIQAILAVALLFGWLYSTMNGGKKKGRSAKSTKPHGAPSSHSAPKNVRHTKHPTGSRDKNHDGHSGGHMRKHRDDKRRA